MLDLSPPFPTCGKIKPGLMNIITYLEKRSLLFWTVVGFLFVILVGIIDVLTGYELAFSLFYLLPISLAAWFAGRKLGIVTCVVSAIVWFIADTLWGHAYSHPAIPYWNTAIRFSFFLITSLLLSALKKTLEHEKELARIDRLTGAVNQTFFLELLQMEIERSQRFRHPFTLAYVDLDNFKAINDRFGHSEGDRVLSTTVKQVKGRLRNTDIVARLGGDEFAFLLPETGRDAARLVISKLQSILLDEMHRNNWPVTFSIGVLTCNAVSQSTDELIRKADELMYSAKNNGKNSVSYFDYAD
jgi:diguanylate cyclase (GGDEF)-like protein